MKNLSLVSLIISLLLFLVACGALSPTDTELFDELDSYTNADGEIEFSSSLSSSSVAKPTTGNIMFETFTTTTPKGKAIEGWVVFEGNDAPLFPAGTEFKFRGKLSVVQGQKVMSGFLLNKDGKPLPFLAYKAGSEFDASFDGKSVGNTFSAKAEFAKKENSPAAMVARTKDNILLGLLSEGLGFPNGVTKEPVTLELTALIDGIVAVGETAVTVPGFGTVKLAVVGLLSCNKASGLQECTISK